MGPVLPQLNEPKRVHKAWPTLEAQSCSKRNSDQKPTDTFGTAARFQWQWPADRQAGPGPGSYNSCYSLENSFTWHHDSISRKGYGPLLSKAPRLEPRHCYTGPGPGTYEEPRVAVRVRSPSGAATCPQQIGSRQPGMQRNSGSAGGIGQLEAEISWLDAARPRASTSPGPATYDARETHFGERLTWLGLPGHVSAFRAAARKFRPALNPSSPPPGSYNLAQAWGTQPAKHTNFAKGTGHRFGGSKARSPARPKLHGIAIDPAIAGPALPSNLEKALVDENEVPGPGAYDNPETLAHRVEHEAIRLSGAFCQPLVETDRTGKPTVPVVERCISPGPSTYADHSRDFSRGSKAISAPFLDCSHRSSPGGLSLAHLPPGPALYSPYKPPVKISHRIPREKFVSAVAAN